jgi:hypothetical protein
MLQTAFLFYRKQLGLIPGEYDFGFLKAEFCVFIC